MAHGGICVGKDRIDPRPIGLRGRIERHLAREEPRGRHQFEHRPAEVDPVGVRIDLGVADAEEIDGFAIGVRRLDLDHQGLAGQAAQVRDLGRLDRAAETAVARHVESREDVARKRAARVIGFLVRPAVEHMGKERVGLDRGIRGEDRARDGPGIE